MRKKFQFSSVFIKTFLMLCVSSTVLLVIFNVSFISFYNKAFEERLFASNLNMLTKTRNYLDLLLGDVVKEANLLAQDASIIRLAVVPSISHSATNHNVVSRLRSVVAENRYIKSVYLYIATGDYVFSSSGAITSLDAFADKGAINAEPGASPPSGSIAIRTGLPGEAGPAALTVYKDFPKDGVWRLGQVVINLNTEALNAAIRNHADVGSDELVVVDRANRVVLGDYPLGSHYAAAVGDEGQREGYRLLADGGPGHVLFHSASTLADWRCLYRVEQSRGSLFAQLAFTVFLPASFIFLIISFLFAAFLSNSLYGPIDSLLKLVRVGQEQDKDKDRGGKRGGNEYDLIRAGFSGIVERKERLEQLVESSIPFVKVDFFSMLLHNDELDRRDLAFFEQYLDVEAYRSDRYAVFIAGLAAPADERPPDLVEQRFALLKVRDDIDGSEAGFEHIVCSSSRPAEVVAVCRFARGVGDEQIRVLLAAFIERLKAASESAGTTKITISAGKVYAGIESIARSYAEAQEAMRYSRYIAGEEPAQGEAAGADEEPTVGRGQLERIHDIVVAIGAGETAAASAKVAALFAQARVSESRAVATQTALKLLDTIAQFLITSNHRGNDIMARQREVLRRLDEIDAAPQIGRAAADFCAEVAQAIAGATATRHSRYVIKAQEYIEENYANCELSLNSAASHVGLTASYLSTLFKNETQESFIDCVNRLRIRKARELLDHTLITVKEAGYAVGFSTINNFIRTFKKFAGTTPGKYNEAARSAGDRGTPL